MFAAQCTIQDQTPTIRSHTGRRDLQVLLLLLRLGLAKKSHDLLPPLFRLVLYLLTLMGEAVGRFNHVVEAGDEQSDG